MDANEIVSVIESFTNAMEIKNAYTQQHSERVTKYAVLIAQELDLYPSTIERIQLAGRLHDLGKITIDTELLDKKSKLTSAETTHIKQHPEIAYEIVKPLKIDERIKEIILQHHERYDGTGYPAQLFGNEIRIEARILAVADAFDAMATSRAYRNALHMDDVLNELYDHANIQFDPDVVNALMNIIKKKVIRTPEDFDT